MTGIDMAAFAGLRKPMTPAECDLRGFGYMPLDIVRLLDSDLYALSTGEEFKAAVTLWGKAWSQVPAASLPDDERILAKLVGVSLAEFRTLAPLAMRGWVKCNDGRLYHTVVAEKALEAWVERLKYRRRSAKAHAARYKKSFDEAPFDAAESLAIAMLLDLSASGATAARDATDLLQADQDPATSSPDGCLDPPQNLLREGKRSEENLLLEMGAWILGEDIIKVGRSLGLDRTLVLAAEASYRKWWAANRPTARKTAAGWSLAFAERLRDIARDPKAIERLKRTEVSDGKPRLVEIRPLPLEGPQWWLDVAAKLLEIDPVGWSTWWAACEPSEDEMNVLIAANETCAERINNFGPLQMARAAGVDIEVRPPAKRRRA